MDRIITIGPDEPVIYLGQDQLAVLDVLSLVP